MENKCTTALCFIFNPIYKDRIVSFFESITKELTLNSNMIEIGKNNSYDVDVNKMIRKTIFDFRGHEDDIKSFMLDNKIEGFLEIVPQIMANCDIKPMLSLDDDIIEFLYKSGIRMDLDYYIY